MRGRMTNKQIHDMMLGMSNALLDLMAAGIVTEHDKDHWKNLMELNISRSTGVWK